MRVPESREDIECRKSSTINSMYIGTTISKPNVDSIITAVATIIHSQMLEVSIFHILEIFTGSKSRQRNSIRV